MNKRRFTILAVICLASVALAVAGAQTSTTTTIGNLPTNASPSPGYFTVVANPGIATWKTSLSSIVQSVIGIPVTVAKGGTGVASPNPLVTSVGCGALSYSGTWPSQILSANFNACTTPAPGSTGYVPVYATPPATALPGVISANVQNGQNVMTLGAKCDGVTDDSAIINAITVPAFLPDSRTCYVNESFTALPNVRFYGQTGNLETVESGTPQPRSYNWSSITSAPSWTAANINYIGTAFNGDLSHVHRVAGTFIKGSTTLTQPTTGYVIYPVTSMNYSYLLNNSGWNQDTGDNVGRTAAAANYTVVTNGVNTLGDTGAYYCNGSVSGAKSGATSFLANPAVECLFGGTNANASGDYLDTLELTASDNGNDAAAVGGVFNMNRTVSTGALGAIWQGVNVQSKGSSSIDSAFFATGKITIGLDLTGMSGGTLAMAMPSGDTINFNATNGNVTRYSRYTVAGTASLGYNSTSGAIQSGVPLSWNNGPTLNTGAGAPTGACTAGSIYTRNDSGAAANSEMYVCRNVSGTGTWEAVTGG